MPEARREGSPYPKADLVLRGLARLTDLMVAFVVARASFQAGPFMAVSYLLLADGLMGGQSVGKRVFGVRTVNVRRRAPAGYRESVFRNAPFALVAIFWSVPLSWPMSVVAGLPILGFETYMVLADRFGVRFGDVLAGTQVVDAKVVSRADELARGGQPAVPAPPGSTSGRTTDVAAAGSAR